jgi:hypothetical protein
MGHQARPLARIWHVGNSACKAMPCLLYLCCISVVRGLMYCDAEHFFSIHSLTTHTQADAQDFERLLMEEPLLMVRDLSDEFKDDTGETELLRNYEFNISQGIVQRVSRFFDALALMNERGEAPLARGEGNKYADSARGGVMGFGRKRNVCNQERHPARRVAWEQQDVMAALAKQSSEMTALRTQVAAMQQALGTTLSSTMCHISVYIEHTR